MFQIDKEKAAKLVCIAFILLSLLCYRHLNHQQEPVSPSSCIVDKSHQFLMNANRKIADSGFWRSVLIGCGQLVVDGIGISVFGIW